MLIRRPVLPASIRSRMILFILLAALPLTASAMVLAWRSYESTLQQGAQRNEAALVGFLSDQREELSDAARMLAALGRVPGIDTPRSCPMLAAVALRLGGDRLTALAVHAATGAPICSAGSDDGLAAFGPLGQFDQDRANNRSSRLERLPPGTTMALGRVSRQGGALVLPVAVTVDGRTAVENTPGTPSVTIDAMLRMDIAPRSTDGLDAIWLEQQGVVVPFTAPGTDRGNALLPTPPDAAVRRALIRGDRSAFAPDADGWLQVYSAGVLPDGTSVIGGSRATNNERRAATLLFRRFSAIALLLLFGLVAVTVGAHVAVVAPVQALTRRVGRWRAGGSFEAGPLRFEPRELAELGSTFDHAVAALAEREAALAEATAAQELLIKEIHHRVKNNLQIVASLLNLQASRIRAPEAKAEFGAARDRVRALATLHRHLYAEGGLHTIAMRPFLLELCGQLFQAMGERAGNRIRLDVEAPELDMSSDQAVPLALIITEAVSNALKYAFPAGRSGHVSVRVDRDWPRDLLVEIKDDGIGIPAGIAETETGIRDGLGRQLIRGFARQLGGTLTVTEDGGTSYALRMALKPVNDPAEAAPRPDAPATPVAASEPVATLP